MEATKNYGDLSTRSIVIGIGLGAALWSIFLLAIVTVWGFL